MTLTALNVLTQAFPPPYRFGTACTDVFVSVVFESVAANSKQIAYWILASCHVASQNLNKCFFIHAKHRKLIQTATTISGTNIYNKYTDIYMFIVFFFKNAVELQTPQDSDDEPWQL